MVLYLAGACILTGVIDADEYWPAEGSIDQHHRGANYCDLSLFL